MRSLCLSSLRSLPVCWLRVYLFCAVTVLSACSELINGVDLPTNVLNPNAVKNDRGAESIYRGVIGGFNTLYAGVSVRNAAQDNDKPSISRVAGLLSDELIRIEDPSRPFPQKFLDRLDSRLLFAGDDVIEAGSTTLFKDLNRLRVRSQEARGMIRKYSTNSSSVYIGHLFAIEGFLTIMLADLYCSGIPLGTVDFERDYTLTRGFTTVEVYQHAIALFDSADRYVGDSTRFVNFSRVGRARSELAIGNLLQAQAAVAGVPTDFAYQLPFTGLNLDFKYAPNPNFENYGDREGSNGLPFRFSEDPRTTLPALKDVASPLTISSGVEARLIEAEALLMQGDANWLPILNKLRTTCVTSIDCATPAPAGTGKVSGLPPLDDPASGISLSDTGARSLRLDVVLTERAYWTFLTGHRQGDLRRVIRNYHRPQNTVYPIGRYWSSGYGSSVNLPVPQDEQQLNSLYRGCVNRDA